MGKLPGELVGAREGECDGNAPGAWVGTFEGDVEGLVLGAFEGEVEGESVCKTRHKKLHIPQKQTVTHMWDSSKDLALENCQGSEWVHEMGNGMEKLQGSERVSAWENRWERTRVHWTAHGMERPKEISLDCPWDLLCAHKSMIVTSRQSQKTNLWGFSMDFGLENHQARELAHSKGR